MAGVSRGHTGICLTGQERTTRELARRIKSAPPEWFEEVRLDWLRDLGEEVFELIAEYGEKIVATCRPIDVQGGFQGPEGQRIDILERASRAGAGIIDVELDSVESGSADQLMKLGGSTKVMVSLHDQRGCANLDTAVRRLQRTQAPILKLAVAVKNAKDLILLADAADELAKTAEVVVVGMGPAGLWTRIRPGDFQSKWTYLVTSPELATAPGQVTIEQARSLRVEKSANLKPIALVGGPAVLNSPGPWAYGRLFEAFDLDYQYLPLVVVNYEDAQRFLKRVGSAAFSVTMPFKEAAFRSGTPMDRWTSMAGIANTVTCRDDGYHLWNTDTVSARELLGDKVNGSRVLVLGAGATARSIVSAIIDLGGSAIVTARNPLNALAEWEKSPLGGLQGWQIVDWDTRFQVEHDVLVNATPLGADGLTDPWDGAKVSASFVMDVARGPDQETPFVKRCRENGVTTASGLDFWCRQGSAQIGAMTGIEVSPSMILANVESPGVALKPAITPHDGRNNLISFVSLPGSKSLTQRYLMLAALADRPSVIEGASNARDCKELMGALTALGVGIEDGEDGELFVDPRGFPKVPDGPIDCGNGGTTCRFICALAPIVGPMTLKLGDQMAQRPMDGLFTALEVLGVSAERRSPNLIELRPNGRVAEFRVAVDVSDTSQFVSGLVIMATRLPRGIEIHLAGEMVSQSYLDMTIKALQMFGATATRKGQTVYVKAERPGGRRVLVEGDASLAAFWAVAQVIGNKRIYLRNQPGESMQDDAMYAGILRGILAGDGAPVDLRSTPDLLPPMIGAALFAPSRTVFQGIGHARLKESNRPSVLVRELSKIGARIGTYGDKLIVEPGPLTGGVVLDPSDDHRMAMLFGILSMAVDELTVLSPNCVEKSYPGWWGELERLR